MLTWNSSFETGHPQIDAEHQEFFARLNALRAAIDGGAGRERIVEMITFLQKYTLVHFAREEVHMRRVSCPALTENCTAHREFSQRLERWLDLLTISGTPVSVLSDVHRETSQWIEAHITSIDCRLRGCSGEKRGSTQAAATVSSNESVQVDTAPLANATTVKAAVAM